MSTYAEALARHRDDENCMFTTTGRRSGRPHRIEIWFGVLDDDVHLISGNGVDADWYRNALAHPAVTLELGDESFAMVAASLDDPDRRRQVGDVMDAKYGWGGDASIGLTRRAWSYERPVLVLRHVS